MGSGDTLVYFTPLACEQPLSGFAAFDTRGQHPVLDFGPSLPQSAVFAAVLPQHYGGGGLRVTLVWSSTAAPLWTEAGDDQGVLSAWQLHHASAANTDQGNLYWSLTVEGSQHVVSLYKASAKSAADLVARGSLPVGSPGTCLLVACNDSGLSGQVVLGPGAVADTDGGNTLTANRVKWGVAIERLPHDSASIDDDNFASVTSVYAPPATASGRLQYTEIALAHGAPIDGLLAGEPFRLKVTRDPNDPEDVLAGDAELRFVVVRET